MDRRTFLQAGGAAALASLTGVGHAQAPASAPRKRAIRKALMLYMCKDGATIADKFAIIKRAGFEGVEIDSPSGLDLDEVLAATRSTGVAVCGTVDSVHWKQTLSDPDPAVRKQGVAALETALRDCKKVGGDSVLLVPAIVNATVSYDQAYRRSQEEIRKVLPLAAELQVKIAIENVWNDFLLSPLEAARYVDELQSPWVGWHFDCGNIVNYGFPEQWVRILGKRLVKLHFKDYSRKRRDDEGRWKGFDVKLGEGDANYPAIMAALDEVGFAGWGSAEVSGGDEAHLTDVSARIDRILAS